MTTAQYQGFWIRFLAYLVDGVLIFLPAFVINVVLIMFTSLDALTYFIGLAVFCITVYMDGIYGGTPGKLILEMRIVNENGEYLGISGAFLRYLCKLLMGLTIGVGFFIIGFTEKKQGLHDMLAKTFVVRA